jgi:D-serine deaminase-like pyridoxal phosphate-dependent protein
MLQPPPARPGQREDEVDTPALLIDLDAFDANLATMSGLLAGTGVGLRAHAKTHKSAVVAHRQIAQGAVGQCVQKVAEAEALAWGGVANILISNEVVGTDKLARVAALARITTIALCADSPIHVAAIEAAARDAGVTLTVLVEIDVGMNRAGCAPGSEAVALAQQIAASPHLRFGGLQSYHGSAQHRRTLAERRTAVDGAVEATRRTVDMLRQQGLACAIVGGAGTGTFELETASGVYNEIQAGSYCFMDVDYGKNLDANGQPVSTFRHALFVLSTVMSQPRPGIAVVDAGHKAVAIDSGVPVVWQRPDLTYSGASDEHGRILIAADATPPRIGDKLRLVPGHCDPTVDRYDWYVGIRNGRVESLWPIAARGGVY